MHALRSEGDGRDRATAADAAVTAMEARMGQEAFRDPTHLAETDGARERKAGVAERFAGSIDKQTARGVGGRHERGITKRAITTGEGSNFHACPLCEVLEALHVVQPPTGTPRWHPTRKSAALTRTSVHVFAMLCGSSGVRVVEDVDARVFEPFPIR